MLLYTFLYLDVYLSGCLFSLLTLLGGAIQGSGFSTAQLLRKVHNTTNSKHTHAMHAI